MTLLKDYMEDWYVHRRALEIVTSPEKYPEDQALTLEVRLRIYDHAGSRIARSILHMRDAGYLIDQDSLPDLAYPPAHAIRDEEQLKTSARKTLENMQTLGFVKPVAPAPPLV